MSTSPNKPQPGSTILVRFLQTATVAFVVIYSRDLNFIAPIIRDMNCTTVEQFSPDQTDRPEEITSWRTSPHARDQTQLNQFAAMVRTSCAGW